MKVGLVTTVAPERCGVRVYCEELIKNSALDNPDIQFKLIGRPFDSSIIGRSQDCDIVHFNHVWSLFGGISSVDIQTLRSLGKKTVCTYNDSSTENRCAFTMAFDRVVVHEPITTDGFTYIKHGIPWTELNPKKEYAGFIGTSGFPIPFKNYPLAAQLAKAVGMRLLAFTPQAAYGDATSVARDIMRNCPGSIVDTTFPEHDVIVRLLSECEFSIFPYSHCNSGVGGSARVGIGAQRPVVISTVVRFADILHEDKYSKEFYIIPSGYPTFENSLPVVQQVVEDIANHRERIPVQTLKDMSWRVSAQEYVNIYRELMAS